MASGIQILRVCLFRPMANAIQLLCLFYSDGERYKANVSLYDSNGRHYEANNVLYISMSDVIRPMMSHVFP